MSVDLDIRYKVPSLIGFVHLIHEINCLLSDMVSNCKVKTVAHSLYSVIQKSCPSLTYIYSTKLLV